MIYHTAMIITTSSQRVFSFAVIQTEHWRISTYCITDLHEQFTSSMTMVLMQLWFVSSFCPSSPAERRQWEALLIHWWILNPNWDVGFLHRQWAALFSLLSQHQHCNVSMSNSHIT